MKTAIEVAQDLTSRPAAAEPTELPYEDAYKIALETGTTVEAVQNEHRRKQTPLAPLAKAMLAHSAALSQVDKASGAIEEALSIQAQFEALVQRRAEIRATLARGQELLNESVATVESLTQEWLNWHTLEANSPGRTQAVFNSVASLAMREKMVAMFPAWQEHQSGQLHQVNEQLARFERDHNLKAK